uniref:HYR domain-containing protein n=1 Tax=Clytia hemisphaerica TaxID=252671 RepID=A0A7M5V322_9CNID
MKLFSTKTLKIFFFLGVVSLVTSKGNEIYTEKPKLVSCPGNIAKEITTGSIRIFWNQPVYTDNCGKTCLTIIPDTSSGSRFLVDSIHTVRYIAKDPSGNRNEECVFTVEVKRKGT